jgi:hypothetical protein
LVGATTGACVARGELATTGGHVTNRHELHAYDYVNRPYEAVRDALLASPLTIFRHATTAAASRNDAVGAELHAKLGPVDIAAQVAVEIVAIEHEAANERPATRFVIEWKSLRRAGLFPTMRATLTAYALTPTETQLELAGVYDPPLGVVGDAIDAIGMHRIATESVTGFVRDVAVFLRSLLASNHAA